MNIKKALLTVLFVLICSDVYALDLSRVKTWSASEILTAADLNAEFNNILNHSLTNNDIDAAAGILGSKLDLTTTGGAIGTTSAAAGKFTTLQATGALTIDSTSIFKDKMSFTQIDNLEYIDSLTDGELDFEATTSLNLRINATEQVQVFDGKVAPTTDDDIDLGDSTHEYKDLWIDGTANIDSLVADTADINGGTMDGVQIGGTTATGELIVNDASDDADGLGSQGTAAQYLASAGTGANPTWSDLPGKKAYFLVRMNTAAAPCTFDETGGFDLGSNFATNTFTVPVTGYYHFNIRIKLTKDASATLRSPAFHLRETSAPSNINDFTESLTTDSQVYALRYETAVILTAGQTIQLLLDTLDSTVATLNDIYDSYWEGYLVAE